MLCEVNSFFLYPQVFVFYWNNKPVIKLSNTIYGAVCLVLLIFMSFRVSFDGFENQLT